VHVAANATLGLAVAIVAVGCGTKAVSKTVTKTVSSDRNVAVHVYFCTLDTCSRAATRAQIQVVMSQAAASPLVKSVTFVSRRQALEIMRRKHPKEISGLPANPFPDALTVIPRHPTEVASVAALFRADPSLGIDEVDYFVGRKLIRVPGH